jgi:hypothetical protein
VVEVEQQPKEQMEHLTQEMVEQEQQVQLMQPQQQELAEAEVDLHLALQVLVDQVVVQLVVLDKVMQQL